MGVFSSSAFAGHTHVLFGADDAVGLRAIIAMHSTALGPALGGTRFYPYQSEEDAITDVLRLSRGMTLKNAAAGLDYGGGKAVIIGDPKVIKTEGLLRAFGRMIDSLGGRYVTAEDVGTTTADMEVIGRETDFVAGQDRWEGGSGDPSPATALGVFAALQAGVERVFGSDSLTGLRVVVQGVGKVGYHYVGLLVDGGAEVLVSDVDESAIERVVEDFGVKPIPTQDVLTTETDILSPCALGGLFNDETIASLQCRLIVGSANNQLCTEADAQRLADRGILYAPDFVANAGGVINVADELHGYSTERAMAHVQALRPRMAAVFDEAAMLKITPQAAAVKLALGRIEAVAGVRMRWNGAH